MPSVKTRRKRKLGKYLLELREAARIEQPDVAQRLRKSPATVSKIENGHVSPDFPALTALLMMYKATEEQTRLAEELWEDAQTDSTRVEHSSGMPPKYKTFLRMEAEAETELTLEQTVIPGLLQTYNYAKAMHTAMHRFIRSEADAKRGTSSRLRRQERLRGSDTLELHALIDEAVIWRMVASSSVMAEQLRHLLIMSDLPNVTIQVIPFGAGEYPVMTGSVTILGFVEENELEQVYLESPGSGQLVDNSEDVRKFVDTFKETAALSLPIEESVALIRAQAEALEQGP